MIKIDVKNIKLTKAQKKLAMIAGIVILAFIIFIRFIYLPQRARFEELKKELELAEKEIGEIKKTAGAEEEKTMATALASLQKKLKTLEARFPDKEEMILRELPAFANKFGIEIKSMQPQKKREVKGTGKEEVIVKGYKLEDIQIAISAVGRYRNLGEYIKALREGFPAIIKINSLALSRGRGEDEVSLNISMTITAYLLSPAA